MKLDCTCASFEHRVPLLLQIVTYDLFDSTGTCAMQNRHLFCAHHDSIVDVCNYLLQRFIHTHASHIQSAVERQFAPTHLIGNGCCRAGSDRLGR